MARARNWWRRHPVAAAASVATAALAVVLAALGIAAALTQNVTSVTSTGYGVNAYPVTYTLTNAITAGGETISNATTSTVITFPPNYDLSNVTSADVRSTFSNVATNRVNKVGNTLEVRWTNNCPASTSFNVTVANVRNASQPGAGYSVVGTFTTSAGVYPFTRTIASALTAQANAVTFNSVTLASMNEGAPTTYTVNFTPGALGRISGDAAAGANTIVITLPAGTMFSGSLSADDVTVNGVRPSAVSVGVNTVTVTMPAGLTVSNPSNVVVEIGQRFGIVNGAAGLKTVTVRTSAQTTNASRTYTIAAATTVIAVEKSAIPADACVTPGQSVVAYGFTMQRVQGVTSPSMQTITFQDVGLNGADPARDVTTSTLYRDDGDGTYDAGDTALVSAPFVGTTATFNFAPVEPVGVTVQQYWLVHQVSSAPVDGDVLVPWLSGAVAFGGVTVVNNVGASPGNPAFTVDGAGPAITFTEPSSDGTRVPLGTMTIAGTAADAVSAVSTMKLKIRRDDDGYWWNGISWQSTESTLDPAGTDPWAYAWGVSQASGDITYTIMAVGTDTVGNVATAQRTVVVDMAGPAVVFASAYDQTHVDVRFSETVTTATAQVLANYSIPGLGISGAVLLPGGNTVRLTTTAQTALTNYTLTASGVCDLLGHPMPSPGSADFTGSYRLQLTVASSAQPPADYVRPGTTMVVDGFTLTRTVGSGIDTVTGVTIENVGTTPGSAVSAVYVYADNGDGVPNTAVDARLNTTGATFSGTDAVVTFDVGLRQFIGVTQTRYWVVYVFSGTAPDAAVQYSRVKSVAHGGDSLVNNAVRGNAFTVSTAVTTLALSTAAAPPTGRYAAAGSSCYVDGFTMRLSQGLASAFVSSITIRDVSPPAGSQSSVVAGGVDIYRDTNGNGVWDPAADQRLNAAPCAFSGSLADAVVTFMTPERVTSTSRQYFVVYTFSTWWTMSTAANSRVFGVAHTASSLANSCVQSADIFLDTAYPTVSVTTLVTNQALLSGTSHDIRGLAADSGSGLSAVAVSIRRSSDGLYWSGAGSVWTSAVTWNAATPPPANWLYAWQFNPASQDGTPAYTVTARVTDVAGNQTLSAPISNVIIDNTGPLNEFAVTSASRPPTSTAAVATLRCVDGFTLQRTAGNQTVNVYGLTVKAGGQAQAGSLVTGVDLYRDANGNGVFDAGTDVRVTPSSAVFTDDTAVLSIPAGEQVDATSRQYFVVYRFSNTAPTGSQIDCQVTGLSHTASYMYNNLIRSNPVIVDNVGPVVRILSPLSNTTYFAGNTATVSGITGDSLSEIATVGVAVQRSDNSQYWNAATATWGAPMVFNPVSGTYAWTFDWQFSPSVQAGAPSYTLFAQALDTAGNTTNASSVTLVRVNNTLAPATIAIRSGSQPTDGIAARSSSRGVDGFRMRRSAGSRAVSVSSITVRHSGTSPAANVVSGVDVYRDGNGDGVWQAGRDTKLNGASGVFVGTDATVSFSSAEPVEDAERQYFVVYRFSATASDGAVSRSTIAGAAHTASVLDLTPSTGGTFLVDAAPPAVAVSAPVASQSFGGTSTVVTGTASDGVAGLAAIDICVQRSGDGLAWDADSETWKAGPIWNRASGTASWQYLWEFDPPSQDGARTYTVTARASDAVGNAATAAVAALRVSNGGSDSTSPTVPTGVSAVPGAFSPRVADVTWSPSSDAVGVKAYRVWRATSAGGSYAFVGSALTTAFSDDTGVTGQGYFYKVSALDAAGNESALSAASAGVTATWHQPPHATYGATDLCVDCHDAHTAASASKLFRYENERTTCLACHDGTGANGNVKTGREDSFALTSGHALEQTTTAPDLTNGCSGCHSPHHDWEMKRRLAKESINGTAVADDATWCLACHNDGQDWYVQKHGAYPALDSPSRDASGYPVAGTFPGRSVYLNASKNAHARIPAASEPATRAAGDCRHCHTAHRGVSEYDGLLATFTPPAAATLAMDRTEGSYAAACFGCHDGSREASGAPDVKRFVTYGGLSDLETSGHRIKSAGASLPVNAPLPCYDCHNPHGSSRGNGHLLSDVLGANLDTTLSAGPDAVRRFCLTCHTTWETYGWDSVAATYTLVGSSARIEGLRRDGGTLGSGPEGAYNWLRLKNTAGHLVADTGESCYACHGSDYSGASSRNVHRPAPGGGVRCYACHDTYKVMDMADPSATSSHHHVLGSNATTYSGDTTAYPTAQSQVYCLSCHADHDVFADDIGANLRTRIDAPSAEVTDTDFIAGGTAGAPGICVSCHQVRLDKRTAYQKAAVPAPAKTPALDPAGYAASAHRYTVSSSFGSRDFRADCAKCHNDTRAKEFQTSAAAKRFGTHDSSEGRLLGLFGLFTTDPMEERACYGCHSRATEGLGSAWTPASPTDFYGAAAMSTASVGVKASMDKQYGHIVSRYTNVHRPDPAEETTAWLPTKKHVECADCHNVHAARTGTHAKGTNLASGSLAGVSGLAVSLPTTGWVTPTQYSYVASVTYEYQICLKCHSGANAGLSTWDDSAPAAWTDVALEFNTKNHSFHPVFGALNSPGSGSTNLNAAQLGNGWSPGMTMYCTDCHADDAYSPTSAGPHGSATPHLLKGPNRNWPDGSSEPLYGQYQLGLSDAQEAGLFCLNCHPNLNSSNSALTNSVHTQSAHRFSLTGSASYRYRGACTTCHLLVPHGGKIGRLLAGPSANVPARYKGPSPTPASIGLYSKPAAGAYLTGSPWAGSNCSAVACGGINHAVAAGFTYESW